MKIVLYLKIDGYVNEVEFYELQFFIFEQIDIEDDFYCILFFIFVEMDMLIKFILLEYCFLFLQKRILLMKLNFIK